MNRNDDWKTKLIVYWYRLTGIHHIRDGYIRGCYIRGGPWHPLLFDLFNSMLCVCLFTCFGMNE